MSTVKKEVKGVFNSSSSFMGKVAELALDAVTFNHEAQRSPTRAESHGIAKSHAIKEGAKPTLGYILKRKSPHVAFKRKASAFALRTTDGYYKGKRLVRQRRLSHK